MKVVLFCGGRGLRMGEMTALTPKPMVRVGSRPIIWHIMRYYAHHGHTEFVLCLGHQADAIKQYFLTYNEALSNDFRLSLGGAQIEVARRDVSDWTIDFVDTGLQANVGERLRRVRRYVSDDEMFLAHYGDTLTDAPLPQLIDELERSQRLANFLCVRPRSYTFHTVRGDDDGRVTAIRDINDADIWINGGYFVLRPGIFDYIEAGEELVHEPFQRLIDRDLLMMHRYEGFWAPMDTLKDQSTLQLLAEQGRPPWAVWEPGGAEPEGDAFAAELATS
jgi:glucose-1-phosphate cytidylyltransferase